MSKKWVYILIDLPLLLGAIWLALTGLLISLVLPPRSGNNMVWGLTRHEWGDVHFWTAMVLLALLVIHLAVHWSWLCATIAGMLGRTTLPGRWARHLAAAAFVAVLLAGGAIFLWTAWTSVRPNPDRRGWVADDSHRDEGYRGGGRRRGWAALE